MDADRTDKRARLLLVDDHPVFRRGLRLILEGEGFEVVGEAADSQSAMREVAEHRPDLAVLDLMLGGILALELIKDIRAFDAKLPILVVSMHEDTIYGERAIAAGACGYVNKTEAADKVVDAARRLLKGKMFVSEELGERIIQRKLRGDAPAGDPVGTLSDRETEVFALLGKGGTSREIGEALGLSGKTVETYRARIKEKLGVETNGELVRRAVEWRLSRDADGEHAEA